jgi:hypothetical protein
MLNWPTIVLSFSPFYVAFERAIKDVLGRNFTSRNCRHHNPQRNRFSLLICLLLLPCENKCQRQTAKSSLHVLHQVQKFLTRKWFLMHIHLWMKGICMLLPSFVEREAEMEIRFMWQTINLWLFSLRFLYFFFVVVQLQMNKNLSRETLKFNKLLYFAWRTFYGRELFIFQIA